LIAQERPVRQHELVSVFEMDKSSVLRFLNTLENHSLVERGPDKSYRPGSKLEFWAKNLRSTNTLALRARPFLRTLAMQTGQTAHLAVLRDNGVVLLDVMPSDNAVGVRQTPGDWEPLYCSAVGKAILAFLPPVEQQTAIERIAFRELTPKTLSAPHLLRSELQVAIKERVAFDDAENNPLISCVASPVLDLYGYPTASVGISYVTAIFPTGPRAQRHFISAVHATADAFSRALTQPCPAHLQGGDQIRS